MTLLTTSPSLFKFIIQNTIDVLTTYVLTTSLTNESGVSPYEIGIRGQYSPENWNAPNVVVSFRPGTITLGPSESFVAYDADLGLWRSGATAVGSQIRLTVQGTSEAERQWLIDALVSGILVPAPVDSYTNQLAPNVVIDTFGSFGVVITGIMTPEYIPANLSDPRQEGQVYEATLPILCDVSLSWLNSGFSTTSAEIDSKAQLGVWYIPDPPITITVP